MPFNQQDIYLVTFLSAFSISWSHFQKRAGWITAPSSQIRLCPRVSHFSRLILVTVDDWIHRPLHQHIIPMPAPPRYTKHSQIDERKRRRKEEKKHINFFDMHFQVLCWFRVFCGCRCCSSILSYIFFFLACFGIFSFASFFFVVVSFIRSSVRSLISPTLLTLSFMFYPCISTFSPFYGCTESTNVYYES